MEMDILKLLIFFLFLLSPIANSNNLCPISYCLNTTLPIKYPFKLQGNHTPNCSYTNLTCTTQGAVILNLPNFGDFYVQDIHYEYKHPLILLYDPQNCVPKRFMASNYSSFSPRKADHFLYYTFYSCPPNNNAWQKFPTIGCLSNSSSDVVATRAVSRQMMTDSYGCREIATSAMPVVGRYAPDFIEDEKEFELEWTASSCESCPYKETEDKVLRYLSEAAFIMMLVFAILVVAVTFIVCCISIITMFREKLLKVKRENANAARITALE